MLQECINKKISTTRTGESVRAATVCTQRACWRRCFLDHSPTCGEGLSTGAPLAGIPCVIVGRACGNATATDTIDRSCLHTTLFAKGALSTIAHNPFDLHKHFSSFDERAPAPYKRCGSPIMSDDNFMSKPVLETLKDLTPIPAATSPVFEPDKKEHADTIAEEPTASHALAMAAVNDEPEEEKGQADIGYSKHPSAEAGDELTEKAGAAQLSHDQEVVNLGWNAPGSQIADPLVGKITNEELWLLLRRFDKQMYHLKEVQHAVPGDLDLNIADEEEFSPDKLRSNIERLYMTVIIGMITFGKHIARLRSWREARRTSWFCTAYTIAWLFDLVVPLLSATLIALIAYPPSRAVLFPPAPIALVNGSTGGVQKPKAGVLGSHDSATGAPENFKGEAVEAEASNFVNGIASVAISSAAGKHPQNDEDDENAGAPQDAVPDPTAIATGAANAKDIAAGGKPNAKHDKTKVPMETALWTKMRPIMHGIADASDTWERFGNALSPTPPFPRDIFRLRLAALVLPILAVSLVTSSYMFMKGVTFGIGFGFFGDPVISRGLSLLNRKFPNWQKLLELRKYVAHVCQRSEANTDTLNTVPFSRAFQQTPNLLSPSCASARRTRHPCLRRQPRTSLHQKRRPRSQKTTFARQVAIGP